MVLINKVIIQILVLICTISARAVTVSESFSLNSDDKPKLKLFLNNKFSIFIYDINSDKIVNQVFIRSANMSIQIKNNWIQLMYYKNKIKITTQLKRSSNGQYVVNNLILKKLNPQFYSKQSLLIDGEALIEDDQASQSDSTALCEGAKKNQLQDLNYLKKIVDSESLNAIQFDKCSQSQVNQIKESLNDIYQKHINVGRDNRLANCLNKYKPELVLDDNLLPLIVLKLEEIANSTSDLNIKCIDLSFNECKKMKLNRTEIYPNQINLCVDSKNELGSTRALLSEVIQHELLHSKDVELSENEVNKVYVCWKLGENSNYISIESAQASASEKSAEIAGEVSFSPAKEIKVEAPPIKLAEQQQFFKQELVKDGVTGNVGVRVADNSPIMNMGSSSLDWANNVMMNVVPAALANESARNPQVAQLAKEFYSGDSGKLTSSLPSNELLKQYGFNTSNSGSVSQPSVAKTKDVNLRAVDNGSIGGTTGRRINLGDSGLNTQGSNSNHSIASTRGLNSKEQASADGSVPRLTNVAQGDQQPSKSGPRSISLSNLPPGETVAQVKQIFQNQQSGNPGSSNVEVTLNFLRNKPSVESVRIKMQNPSFANALKLNKISIYIKGTNGKPITNNNHQFEPQYYFVEKNGKIHETNKGNDQTAFSNDY